MINITQSNRQLTRAERAMVNSMIHEEYDNQEVNLALAAHQWEEGYELRLLSDSYINRIRGSFERFDRLLYGESNQALSATSEAWARYTIDLLEAGYSLSGTDECVLFERCQSPQPGDDRLVQKLRSTYINSVSNIEV